jgi:sugar lactone lactonase YvrE
MKPIYQTALQASKKWIAPLLLSLITLGQPSPRIEFEAPDAYPEGIIYDSKADAFYVSSVRTGTIGKVTPQGKYTILYSENGLKSSYGLKINPDGKRLFACIGDANYSKFKSPDTDKKMIRLISIDIQTGKKLSDTDLSQLTPGKHFGNDLAFDKQGNAFMTDSFANVIYKVTPDGKATIFAKSELFKTAGVGLNGIVWHPSGFLIADSSGKGCLFKINTENPKDISKINTPQAFMNADGLVLENANTLVLVQNGGSNKVYRLESADGWKTAKVKAATMGEDRFAYPSTATASKGDIWVMNAKFNELADSTNVPSKKFSLQRAQFKAVK